MIYGELVEVRAAVTTDDGQTRVCHVEAPRQLGLLKLPGPAVCGPNRQGEEDVQLESCHLFISIGIHVIYCIYIYIILYC